MKKFVPATVLAGLLVGASLVGGVHPADAAQALASTGAARIESASCAPSGLCVVAQGSVLRTSLNWGASWIDSDTLLASEEVAGAACSNTSCFVVGNSSEGAFVGRTTEGSTWKWTSFVEGVTAIGVACGPSSCTVNATNANHPGPGFIRVSSGLVTGGGVFWDDVDASANGLACSDNVNCIAVGEGTEPIGKLRFTTTSATWLPRCNTTSSGCRDSYRHVACSGTTCVAVAGSSRIYATANSGLNWVRRASLAAVTLNSVSCVSSRICVAVGSGGKIHRSTDSGRTWRTVASPTRRNLRIVSCTSTGRCIAAGDAGTLIRTTSSGGSWSLRPALP